MVKQNIAQVFTTTGYFSVAGIRTTHYEAVEDLEEYDVFTPYVTGREVNPPNTIIIVLRKDQWGKTVPHFIHPVSNKIMKVEDGIHA